MAALAHNVLKAVRWLRQSTGPPVPLNPRAAADGVQATPNACGEPTHTDGPQGSWSTESLMMSVAALDERRGPIVARCPSVKIRFFNKPLPPPFTDTTSPLVLRLGMVLSRNPISETPQSLSQRHRHELPEDGAHVNQELGSPRLNRVLTRRHRVSRRGVS